MADTNHNGQLDADELKDTVEEEETVADAFQGDKITKEEAEKIDDLGDLEKEADKIKMEEEMGKASQTATVQPSDIQAVPVVEVPKQEEKPVVATSAPAEVIHEIVKEQTSESTAEISSEPKEMVQEIKKPMI